MKYIKPKKIEKGMTIGIVSISGTIRNKDSVERGLAKLQELGFKTKTSEHLFDQSDYLAGSDKDRLEELHKFFTDPEVDCIMCSRGGYGALRIIDQIDYDLIRNNSKVFCGYSDITTYSAMMLKHAKLITFSSPMLCGDFGTENISDYTITNFLKALSQEELTFELIGNNNLSTEGIAFGGNLTTLASLCGRDFIPGEKFIFIIEDVNEPAYKIDRYLAQLCGISDFTKNIAGFVLGEFTGTSTEEINSIFKDYSQKLEIPYWQGLKLGHNEDKITFPIGSECIIKNNKIFFK